MLRNVTAERIRMSKDARRNAVLDAAILIIGEYGYRGFSINDLARRCDLTTAGLLHHFGSKDGVLVALLKERDRRDEVAVAGALHLRSDQPLSRCDVLDVLRAIVRRNAEQPHLVRLYAVLRAEALGDGHPASEFFLRRGKATQAIFASLVSGHTADAPATAVQIVACMNGLEVQWLQEGCAFDLVAEWDKVSDKLLV